METEIQRTIVNKLVKKGFRVNAYTAGIEPDTQAVLLSKKRGTTTWMAEVEADGTVNGQSFQKFMEGK